MKAMILAAGLGTRLRPLTDNRPKALVEIAGRTLLEITLSRLRAFGINDVIINVYHFADMILAYLKTNNNFGMRIEISREDLLLDTGGGLKKAAWFFLEDSRRLDEPFILHNVDVISTIDLRRMVQFHSENNALATLAVQDRESSRYLLFDGHLQLRGRHIGPSPSGTATPGCAPQNMAARNQSVTKRDNSQIAPSSENSLQEGTALAVPKSVKNAGALAPEVRRDSDQSDQIVSGSQPGSSPPLQPLAFSGIHVISPRLLPMITESGVFSIIDTYLRLAAQREKILAFRADDYYWRDLGRPADLSQAALDLQQKKFFLEVSTTKFVKTEKLP